MYLTLEDNTKNILFILLEYIKINKKTGTEHYTTEVVYAPYKSFSVMRHYR